LYEYIYFLQALEYCEAIAKCINISPTVFQPTLVKLVYEVSQGNIIICK